MASQLMCTGGCGSSDVAGICPITSCWKYNYVEAAPGVNGFENTTPPGSGFNPFVAPPVYADATLEFNAPGTITSVTQLDPNHPEAWLAPATYESGDDTLTPEARFILGSAGQMADAELKSAVLNMAAGDVLAGAGAGLASLSWGRLAIGTTETGNWHVAFKIGEDWLHYAEGDNPFGPLQLTKRGAQYFGENAWFNIPIPVFRGALSEISATAENCSIGACSALWGGW